MCNCDIIKKFLIGGTKVTNQNEKLKNKNNFKKQLKYIYCDDYYCIILSVHVKFGITNLSGLFSLHTNSTKTFTIVLLLFIYYNMFRGGIKIEKIFENLV